MPLYDFQCNECEHIFEIIQKYLDPSVKQTVQYTTTSSTLQKRLGVTES